MNINKIVLSLICSSITITILVAGLWPFNLNPPNKVKWLKEEPGVHFFGPGHIYSSAIPSNQFSNREISLEIWLRPATDSEKRYPQILSLWDEKRQEVFLVGQFMDELFLRVRSRNPKATKGFRERGKRQTLYQGRKTLFTLTSGQEGTYLFENGQLSKTFPGYLLLEDLGSDSGKIILGNSATGTNFWEGDILGLALYNRILTAEEVQKHYSRWVMRNYNAMKKSAGLVALYPFDEGRGDWIQNQADGTNPLLKPKVFQPLQKVILEWPTKEYMKHSSFYEDMAVNILGFIPLGFFFALWLIRLFNLSASKSFVMTFFLGVLISLGIELTQVYLPGRDSSFSDLVFNIMGTAIGIVLQQKLIVSPQESDPE